MDIAKKIKKIPHTPGIYFFRDKNGKIIYIGKAANLKKRVSSYFRKKLPDLRLRLMVSNICDIEYIPTSSSAEALIYEASFIKEKKPKYNIALKDDKSYPYLKLTVKEKYPRLLITRELRKDGSLYYGPYTNVKLLRKAVVFMKRIFPLRTCRRLPEKKCLNYSIGQCIGPCIKKDLGFSYREIVGDMKCFLRGRKKVLIERLSNRMRKFSKKEEYEKALKIRNQFDALTVVLDQTRHTPPLDSDLKELKEVLNLKNIPARIEAFDISNIHGTSSVGSMVTFFNARPLKAQYRRYRIKTVRDIDDYSMIREIVRRRYRRILEEKRNLPDLIIIDGGRGHLNVAVTELKKFGFRVPVISIAKKQERIFVESKEKAISISRRSKAFKLIQRIRDEAHRFALSYHKLVRRKSMFERKS